MKQIKKSLNQQYKSLFYYYDYQIIDYYVILIRAKENQEFRDEKK